MRLPFSRNWKIRRNANCFCYFPVSQVVHENVQPQLQREGLGPATLGFFSMFSVLLSEFDHSHGTIFRLKLFLWLSLRLFGILSSRDIGQIKRFLQRVLKYTTSIPRQ